MGTTVVSLQELFALLGVMVGFYLFFWAIARFLNKKYGITFSTPSKFLPRATARVKFHTPKGYFVEFYHDKVWRNGIVSNLEEGSAKIGDNIDVIILTGPDAEHEVFVLYAIR